MAQPKLFSKRIRKEVISSRGLITSFGRIKKHPVEFNKPEKKILDPVAVPRGRGIPLFKIRGGN
jgi:hypothetical protein